MTTDRTSGGSRERSPAAGALVTWREAPTAAKALIIGTFVHRLGGFIQVFLVLYLTQRGFSTGQAGVALGVYGGGMVLGVLIGGWLSDHIGPRRTIIFSMVITAVLLPCVLYVDSFPILLVVIGLIGAVGQAYRPASTSALSQLMPEARHVMTFAMVRLAINLGTSVGPLIGAGLASVSYNLLFWAEAVVVLVFASVALPLVDTVRTTEKTAGSYLSVLQNRRYVVFLLGVLVTSMVFMQYVATLPLAVVAAGMSVTVYGALLGLNGALVVVCELLIAKRVQHWRPRVVMMIGVALACLGMSLYGLPWGVVGFAFATAVWTIGECIGFPTLFFAYPAKAGPSDQRGVYLGASNSVYGLGSALGPVIGIAIWNQLGNGVWLVCALAGIVAVGLVGIGVVSRDTRSLDPVYAGSHRDGD